MLLSAAEVKPAQANRIQLLTHPAIGLSSHNALRAVRFYAQLNSESSLAAVEQWPKARDPQVRHEALLEDGRDTRLETREAAPAAAAPASSNDLQDLQKTG